MSPSSCQLLPRPHSVARRPPCCRFLGLLPDILPVCMCACVPRTWWKIPSRGPSLTFDDLHFAPMFQFYLALMQTIHGRVLQVKGLRFNFSYSLNKVAWRTYPPATPTPATLWPFPNERLPVFTAVGVLNAEGGLFVCLFARHVQMSFYANKSSEAVGQSFSHAKKRASS